MSVPLASRTLVIVPTYNEADNIDKPRRGHLAGNSRCRHPVCG